MMRGGLPFVDLMYVDAYHRCASEDIMTSADAACRRLMSFLRMMHHCMLVQARGMVRHENVRACSWLIL